MESARRVFNKKGFSEATIDEIMANAGLSHGGFYRHFGSKADLYAEAVRRFLCQAAPEPWQAKQIKAFGASKTKARRVLDAYFSLDHFDDRERCCPLIGLPSEASRSNGDVKEAYREVVEKLLTDLPSRAGWTECTRAGACPNFLMRWRHGPGQGRGWPSIGR